MTDFPFLIWETRDTLIQWYLDLNAWHWPDAIPDPEPMLEPGVRMATTRRWQIMQAIEARVGERDLLRQHNRRMDDQTFAAFWRLYTGEDQEPTGRYAEWVEAEAKALAQRWATHTSSGELNGSS
jgi:hypothetical protein